MSCSLLALFLGTMCVQQSVCQTYQLSLVNGTVRREGRIEIDIKGITGTVCSNGWTKEDAERLCESLGYEGVEKYLVYTFGEGGTEQIWTDISGCIDNLQSTDCDPGMVTSDPSCDHSKDVGVICSPVKIRLVGKEQLLGDTHEGRVEIKYFGEWATVAGLHLGEAHFICRYLGFPEAEFADCCGIFGHATDMPPYRAMCEGDAMEISDCSLQMIHYSPAEQSGVICAKDAVRLVGSDFETEGRVEVHTGSTWHKVCAPDVSMNAGRVICRQLNFDDVLHVDDVSGSNSSSPIIRNISCVGSERTFHECSFQTVPNGTCDSDAFLNCTASGSRFANGISKMSGFAQVYLNSWIYVGAANRDVLIFMCSKENSTGLTLFRYAYNYNQHAIANCVLTDGLHCTLDTRPIWYRFKHICYTECSKETVRINVYGNGVNVHSGLVEIFRNDTWYPVCQDHWNLSATEVACKELNFLGVHNDISNSDTVRGNTNDTRTGGGGGSGSGSDSVGVVLWCDGSESSLRDCRVNDTVECRRGAVEITCLEEGIRFQDSAVDYAGRVEVYTGEKWRAVCGSDWDLQDANVACIMGGFPSAAEAYDSAEFGDGLGDTFYHFHCSGDETSLYSCTHTENGCDQYNGAGLICSHDTIRLRGGSDSAGRVEVFIDGRWGTVCDDKWDFNDALVACRQLGFSNASMAYDNSRYGEGKGAIHFDDMECTGNETELKQCKHLQQHNCLHSEDAGVSCVQEEPAIPMWLEIFNDVKTEGCRDYWFRNDDMCLSVVQFESDRSYNNTIGMCPDDSVTPNSDTSLETLVEYIYALYYHDSNATSVFLWEVRNGCKTLNRSIPEQRGTSWKERVVQCESLQVRALVCQMDIEDQSRNCSNKHFECKSGECILKSLICDGTFDCPDQSDENKEQCITECFEKLDDSDYRGIHGQTEDGTKCALWTDPNNGIDAVLPTDFIGKGIGNHNFCRNPNERCRAWCYSEEFYQVTDCAIPQCTDDSPLDCPTTSFRCASGHCISYSFYCDHKPDCPDNSDEIDCTFPGCRQSDHECDNGRCLESSLRCNGIQDCLDKTDELKCGSCSDSYLRCSDGKCVPQNHICDGKQDCYDGIDESKTECTYIYKDAPICGVNETLCDNNVCVDKRYICQLQRDEFGKVQGCQDQSHLSHCVSFQCPAHTYKCPSSYCIPIKSRCDGKNDCHDGEDEQYCDDYSCPGYFKCQDATNCISQYDVCNDIKDCIRGEDELFCNVTCPVGCICDGLTFVCSGTEWTLTKANSIPSDIRFLNLSRVVSSATLGYIEEQLFINSSVLSYIGILDVSANGIRAIHPNYFKHMKNLKSLFLQDNNISSLEDGVFNGLTRLQHLDIHGNGLKMIGKRIFEGLDELQLLDISGNAIEEYDKDIFQNLNYLRRLNSDDYAFCCLVQPVNPDIEVDCSPTADQFSSCENLMQNVVLRLFLWIFGLSALFGNMFVIAWRARNWPRKNSAAYTQSFLVMNLAVSDALMGLYLLIVACADLYYRDDYITNAKYWKGSFTCITAGILALFSSELSVYSLTVISCDRFLHIAFPFGRFHLTPKTVKLVVAVGWILVMVLSVLPVLPFAYFNYAYYGVTSVCLALPLTSERVQGWEYTVAIIIFFNLFCFILIFLSYTGIFVLIKRSRNNIEKICSVNSLKSQHIALALRMAFIVVTDFCCWVPVIVMGILSLTGTAEIPASVYAWTAVFILPVNSAINPFLYTISSLKNLQKQIKPSKNISESNLLAEKMSKGADIHPSMTEKIRKQTKNIYLLKKVLDVLESEIGSNNEVEAEVNQLLSSILALVNNSEACRQQENTEM